MRDWVDAYIGLGANLGDARRAVHAAITALAQLPHTELLASSSLYGSAPIHASGPDYVNAVARLRTRLNAFDLMDQLQRLEANAGRTRPYLNAPRTLDLDLLRFGDARMEGARLTVPHPRMDERAFVLVPLQEIAPHLVSAQQLQAVAQQVAVRLSH
jgi:2-amino-4-hydroxy-6-hydroxymethyldihydropteridine diphosphokinase